MKIPRRWRAVCLYTIGIFVITPILPHLLRSAYEQWSRLKVWNFLLYVEISLGFLILILGASFFLYRKKKTAFFLLISFVGIFLVSFIVYQFLPNPNKFTHLPEYAVLSFLIIRALDEGKDKNLLIYKKVKGGEKEKKIKFGFIKNSYFMSGSITGFVGAGDEIYQHFLPRRFFGWPDIFLNILGGILGLLIFRGIKK